MYSVTRTMNFICRRQTARRSVSPEESGLNSTMSVWLSGNALVSINVLLYARSG